MSKAMMNYPAAYVGLFKILSEVANEHGYALGMHGSLSSDMDIIAVPWVDTISHHKELVDALSNSIALDTTDISDPEIKPHGRITYTIILGLGGVIDLSVMTRLSN